MGRAVSPPTLHDDARRLLELLHGMISSAFRPVLWKRALELELNYAQAQVLFFIQRHPGCLASDVARAYAVTLPAISQVVDRLAEKHFLVRTEDPRDRRAARLRLTRAGDALARELEGAQVEGLAALLGRLSADERRTVLAGLDALVSAAVRES
ncbi:MAG TPA: MarR family winged helix-turn-helix transcriptional regulator [Methylomirabilota bacterium]|jgi:DNA-binding MarR family transcriptional regulator|nr:MarR family winged helix-turn-helix transcriptional regulator [Methylomirabilota bacterium]